MIAQIIISYLIFQHLHSNPNLSIRNNEKTAFWSESFANVLKLYNIPRVNDLTIGTRLTQN